MGDIIKSLSVAEITLERQVGREEDLGVGLQDRLRGDSQQGREDCKALLPWDPHGEGVLNDAMELNSRGQVWNMMEVLQDTSVVMPRGLLLAVSLEDERQIKDQ